MIIGNGMLAKGFMTAYKEDQNVVVFASGVSISQSTSAEDYAREENLLASTLATLGTKTLLYFSTCSIEEPDVDTMYTRHKLFLEKKIEKEAESYYIFRLPQVAGHTSKRTFFIDFLLFNIMHNTHFDVWKNSVRNVIDLDDVVKVVSYIVENKIMKNSMINIASPYNISVPDYVKQIEKRLSKKANATLVNKGTSFVINIDTILSIIKETKVDFLNQEKYLSNLIDKYYEDMK